MQNRRGIFIVIEGSDGSGKGTQFELLHKRLQDAGHEVEVFDFPRYDHTSSYFVKRYLNGEYGSAAKVNPYTASLFYALDRYEAAPDIRKALNDGKVVLSNRYVGSNMAHQGSKFAEPVEKRSFFVWEDSLEFQLLNIPRPDLNLFLRVPAEVSYNLIAQKDARKYTARTHDEHEADINHLKQSVATYDLLCQLFPRDFKAIDCAPLGRLLSIKEIADNIWDVVNPLLPKPQLSDLPQTTPDKNRAKPTAVSSDHLNVEIASISLLAALHLKKIVPSTHINLLWHSDKAGAYFTPEFSDKKLSKKFKTTMDQIAQMYHLIGSRLDKKLVAGEIDQIQRSILPLSAIVSVKLRLDKDSADETLSRLARDSNDELVKLSSQMHGVVLQKWPDAAKTAQTDAGGEAPEAISSIINKLSNDLLPVGDIEPVKLIDASPRNEFDLIADSLYAYTDLSRPQIVQQIENWKYAQKLKTLQAAINKPDSEVLHLAKYQFDFVTNHQVMEELLGLELASDIQLQPASPRYGYEASGLLHTNNALDKYQQAFDLSLELYNKIQSSGDTNLAEYALLSGNGRRWQATTNAFALVQVNDSKLSDSTKSLLNQMVERVKEVQPIIGGRLAKVKLAVSAKPVKPAVKPKNGNSRPKNGNKGKDVPPKKSTHRRHRSNRPKKS